MTEALTTDNIDAVITPIIERVVGEVVGPLLNEMMDLISERFDRVETRLDRIEGQNLGARITHIEKHLSRKRSFPRLEPATEES